MTVSGEQMVRSADVLVRTALRVTASERFVVVGDAASVEIVAALEAAGRAAGAEVATLRLDLLKSHSTNHSGERPHKVLPDAVRRAMLSAQASAFVACAPPTESSMRDQLQYIASACKVRHAHLPGITPAMFIAGVAVDHDVIAASSARIVRRLEIAREITCTSAAGTNLVVHPGAQRWLERVGTVAAGESVVFPTGSLIVCPESVRGTFAATASLGEFFGARERLLREPILFDIDDGVVVGVRAEASPDLVREIASMLAVSRNSERVGLVVLGLNPGAASPVGVASVDQHRPGLHLVFGDPHTRDAETAYPARTSFAACQTSSSVSIDGVLVVDAGRLTPA